MCTAPTRVVIADDDEPTRALLRALLTDVERIAVVGEARDGVEALLLAVTHEADVVILDVHMPRMDGIEAARVIGRARPDTHFVLHSAAVEPESARRARELGLSLMAKGDFSHAVAAVRLVAARTLAHSARSWPGRRARSPRGPRERARHWFTDLA